MPRVAFINTHPVQYYAPVHRALAARPGWEVRVFFTWHAGGPAHDAGFNRAIAWDVPLTDGYEHEAVPNTARDPGPHHYGGIRNPDLVRRVAAWRPDAAVVTGYAYPSHLAALRRLPRRGIPVLFRGDSHLLDRAKDRWWWLKRRFLARVYGRCARVCFVGQNNRAYFEACGVSADRLRFCPHTIDTARFLDPAADRTASSWRRELHLGEERPVLLFAGKFEEKKAPLELMDAVQRLEGLRLALVLAGDGPLAEPVRRRAADRPETFRVLPFVNQSRMPALYRLADLFVLPSVREETWGLAVNEALASGRPVLVSDRVGCAPDLVQSGETGWVFPAGDWAAWAADVRRAFADPHRLRAMRAHARALAPRFDTAVAAAAIASAVEELLPAAP